MPRKKGWIAERLGWAAQAARWKYALRNPAFRTELQRLSTLYASGSEGFAAALAGFLDAWGFRYVGGEIFAGLPHVELEADDRRFLEAYSDVVFAPPIFPDPTGDGPVLDLAIDLRHPTDLLLSLVEEIVKEAKEKRGYGSSGRRRLDKLDFYLQVYDAAERRETFRAIARSLGKPVSSVKSAFLAARRNVFSQSPAARPNCPLSLRCPGSA